MGFIKAVYLFLFYLCTLHIYTVELFYIISFT